MAGGIPTLLQVCARSYRPSSSSPCQAGSGTGPTLPFKDFLCSAHSVCLILQGAEPRGSGRELSCSKVAVYTKQLCGGKSRNFPRAGTSKWRQPLSPTKLDLTEEHADSLVGRFQGCCQNITRASSYKKNNKEAPSPILFLWVVTKAKRVRFRGISCYDCPVFKIMIRSFSHNHFIQ